MIEDWRSIEQRWGVKRSKGAREEFSLLVACP